MNHFDMYVNEMEMVFLTVRLSSSRESSATILRCVGSSRLLTVMKVDETTRFLAHLSTPSTESC